LDEVVSSVVNNVGVNLNTASASLLRYVSGINSSLAKKIVKYREEKGKIASRQELIAISGMGPKTFEQCAGFLKIPESVDPLDNTWVHPENYEIARSIRETITVTGNLSFEDAQILKEKYSVGDATIKDIVDELKKPNRDPREGYPKPMMQKGVVTFEDLYEGMMITGKIKNVVDFGAFVDLGLKEIALIHISEMSDQFVKDPLETVKVGDILEFRVISLDRDRRRIALSRKRQSVPQRVKISEPSNITSSVSVGTSSSPNPMPEGSPPLKERPTSREPLEHKKKVLVVKKTADESGEVKGGGLRKSAAADPWGQYMQNQPQSEDDGTMYSPFAEAFKKMQKRKERK
jgi:uncharacterized protein